MKRSRYLSSMLSAIAATLGIMQPGSALAAGAANGNTVLISQSSVCTMWQTQATALGFTVEVADSTAWAAKSAADFATYKAIIVPDNNCSGPPSWVTDNRTTWSPSVTGNILVVGGDPDYHGCAGTAGAIQLVYNGIRFAADDPGETGAFLPLGCGSTTTLIDQFGSFAGTGSSVNDVHIVAVHPALTGLTDENQSNWGQSTHAYFTSFPGDFVTLAIQDGVGTSPCFEDGHCGSPYLLAHGTGVQPVGLNVIKTAPGSAAVGDTITYTITYGNSGGTNATGVVIQDPVPATTTFVSATGGGSESGGIVTWNIGAANAGVTGLTVQFTVRADAAGTVVNTGYTIDSAESAPIVGANVGTTVTAPPSFAVTTSPGANGSLSCSPNPVNNGSTTDCTATATTTGYHVASISGCGISYSNTSNAVTTHTSTSSAITGTCTVSAAFAINVYTITASSGGNGSVTCPATADYGTSPVCTPIAATSGYHVYDIFLDGSVIASWSNHSTTGDNTTQTSYGLGVTTSNRSINVTFRKNTFSVTASVTGGNGTLTCPNPYEDFDATPTCTITPGTGYHVRDLTITGTTDNTGFSNHSITGDNTTIASKQLAGSAAPGSARTISAVFRLNTYLVSVAAAGAGSGTISISTTSLPSDYAEYGTSATFAVDEADGSQIDLVTGAAACGTLSGTPWRDDPAPPSTHGQTAVYAAASITGPCTVTATFNADATAPVVTMFSIPAAESVGYTIPVILFTSSDNVHVREFCVSEADTSDDCAWGDAPDSYTFAPGTPEGIHILRGWSRDYAGTVSEPFAAVVTLDFANRAQLPKSGQNRCYDNAGGMVSCASTRQDGDTKAGTAWPAPRFTNPDGSTPLAESIVRDQLTGLEWTRDGNLASDTLSWQEALDYITALNEDGYGGYSDWRLPNRIELESLVNRQRSDVAAWLGIQGFVNVRPDPYWSSTTDTEAGMRGKAWAVNLLEGSTVAKDKQTESLYVFPVRGWNGEGAIELLKTGQEACYDAAGDEVDCVDPETGAHTGQDGDNRAGQTWMPVRFTNLDGGVPVSGSVVVDQSTTLMWLRDAGTSSVPGCAGGEGTWQDSLDYVKCLNTNLYLGYNDWRMPNIVELASLRNAGEADAALWLNGAGFENVDGGIYWSGTTDVNFAVNAWTCGMTDGGIAYYPKATTVALTLPVRGGQVGSGVLSLSEDSIDFGDVIYGGGTTEEILTISNAGTTPLEVIAMMIGGADAGMFSVNTSSGGSPCGSLAPVVAAGGNCTVGVVFAPASSGAKTGSLTLLSSDPARSEETVDLTGVGMSLVTLTSGANGAVDCVPNPVSFDQASACTITPDEGYHTLSVVVDGTSVFSNPGDPGTNTSYTGYTFEHVTVHHSLAALFAVNRYLVTGSSGGHGTIDCASPVDHGVVDTCAAEAAADYHIVEISGCGGTKYTPGYTAGTSGVTAYDYQTGPITGNCTVSAVFAINSYHVSISISNHGSAVTDKVDVEHGDGTTIIFTADEGYHIASIGGCGGGAYTPGYTVGTPGETTYEYETGPITGNCTVSAVFAINRYHVTTSITGDGAASPDSVDVDDGDGTTIAFTAGVGYHITSIGGCGGTEYTPGYTVGTPGETEYDYSTGPVTGNCMVSAVFEINIYTLTARWGMDGEDGVGGSAAPASQQINHGSGGGITVTLDPGFTIAGILSDCDGGLSGETFTTEPLVADCTVTVYFDDHTNPVMGNLVLPGASSSLTIPIVAINATDNHEIAGYYVSHLPAPPPVDDPAWSGTLPTSYTLPEGSAEGYVTLYAWVKDPSGNLSAVAWDATLVTLPAAVDLAETGQQTCYDQAGTVIDCAGTGQDGLWKAGVAWPAPRITDNEDGSYNDLLTGLMIPQDANLLINRDPNWRGSADGRLAWQDALDYIKKLNEEYYLGYTDWRMPNAVEMAGLRDYQTAFGAHLRGEGFINVPDGTYWTATTDMSSTGSAYVLTDAGTIEAVGKSSLNYLLPVRNDLPAGGAVLLLSTNQLACRDADGLTIDCVDPVTGAHTGQDGDVRAGIPWMSPRFEVAESVARDLQTLLVWTADANAPGPESCGPGVAATWQEALDYVGCLNQRRYLGYPDWRLPNVLELASIVNFDAENGGAWLETQGIVNVQAGAFWTSDTDSTATAKALAVSLDGFEVTSMAKTATAWVWPVRSDLPEYANITEVALGSGVVVCSPNPVLLGQTSDCGLTPAPWYHIGEASGCGTGTLTGGTYTTASITGDCTVSVTFAIDTYTLTYTAGDHGSIGGDTPQTVDHGSDGASVTAVPAIGYHFVEWSDDSTDNPRSDLDVTADLSVTAVFAIDTFTLTYAAGSNGAVSPSDDQVVDYGGDAAAVTALADADHHFVSWTVSPGVVVSLSPALTVTGVTESQTYTANFAIDTFVVTTIAGAGGSITPTATVDCGADHTVTVTPDAGYHITEVLVDGAAQPIPDPSAFVLTLTAVREDHSVEASFTPDNTAPTDIQISEDSVDEKLPAGTVVGTFSSVDPDTGDSFTYGLVAGSGDTDNGSFAIVGDELRTAASFLFETRESYSILVRSTDSGGLWIEKRFTIVVIDLGPEPLQVCPGTGPYPSIQSALDAANDDDVIRVAVGTYRERLVLARPLRVTIEGGWDCASTVRSDDPALTMVNADSDGDGRGEAGVLRISAGPGNAVRAKISGLTLTRGGGPNGSGLRLNALGGSIDLDLSRAIIRSNAASHGAGMYAVAREGGRIMMALQGVMVHHNNAAANGGGIFLASSGAGSLVQASVDHVTFFGNSARYGSAIYTNSAESGTDLRLANVVMFKNQVFVKGAGVYLGGAGTTVAADHCDMPKVEFATTDHTGYDPGAGNFEADPLFVNENRGNYHLHLDSPCIDRGGPEAVISTDFEGDLLQGSARDIGADEYVPIDYERLLLLAPVGGERITSGRGLLVTWIAPPEMRRFRVLLSMNGGVTWTFMGGVNNARHLSIAVPRQTITRKNCLMAVVGFNAAGNRVGRTISPAPFTILPQSAGGPGVLNENGSNRF